MAVPKPTPIYRIVHLDNLPIYLRRSGMHAPNYWPDDGLKWKTNHNQEVQSKRALRPVECGPRGKLHDYVAFYFGPRSVMLYQLHTGWVPGYVEGQAPMVYLVSTAQAVKKRELGFVFSNAHGLAAITDWYDDLRDLGEVPWDMVYAKWWKDTADDPDRQRRKQAEFLVHRLCPWVLVQMIGVISEDRKRQVEKLLAKYRRAHQPVVEVHRDWYY